MMTKEIEAIVKSGIIGKILIAFIVLFGIFIGSFVWQNIQADKTLEQLVKLNINIQNLIESQDRIDNMKIDIKESYDISMDEFNNRLLKILGTTLQNNKVPFPQELNEAIATFRCKLEAIKNCLISP